MINAAENVAVRVLEATHPRLLIIIPCYNEAKSIGRLLAEIDSLKEGYHTLVIDDGSSDNTYEIASAHTTSLKLVSNLGIGGAVQTGIKYAFEHDYDYCIQVDGDGQHPPDQIKLFLEHRDLSQANLIIGSRFLGGGAFRSYFVRRIGISIISKTIEILFGKRVSDPTSGLRLMDRKCIELFNKYYPYDYPEPISCAYAIEHGLTLVEVPVQMRDRKSGESSISGVKPIAYMLRVIGYLVLLRLGRYLKK